MRGRERLVGVLCDRGVLTNPALERAFRSVDLERFLPPELRALAYVNGPTPFRADFRGAVLPSPMALAALLQLLELRSGITIGIVGGCGGYPAALAAEAMGSGTVEVAEADTDLREITLRNLDEAGYSGRVAVADDLGAGPFDRILVLDSGQRPLKEITRRLADLGFAISRGGSPDELAFQKRIRSGNDELDLKIADMPAGPNRGAEAQATTWARLLTREDLVAHAWEGRLVGHHDVHFAQGIDETFVNGPLDPKVHTLSTAQAAARRAFHAGYILQCLGDLEEAEDHYGRSLELFPTAEAHTFLGWTYSFRGDLDRAIAECKEAIETDPTFGNPFNDIGAYLVELERPDDAIPWLKKALESQRYCCYFYAHTNLARVYLLRGQTHLARKHLEEALKANPNYEPASEMLRRISRQTDYVA